MSDRNDLNAIGNEARKLLKSAAKANENIAQQKAMIADRNEKVKLLLEQMLDAFKRHQAVNGEPDAKAWAKSVGFSLRNLEYIAYGRAPQKRTTVRFELKVGQQVKFNGM